MDDWDKDIAEMKLSDEEKNGLQFFRNYQRAFEEHAARRFVAQIDAEAFDTSELSEVLSLLAQEDVRLLPLAVCSYADDVLLRMFKAYLPERIPGGKAGLFGPYGPLSSLAGRIRMAFAFDLISEDVLTSIDRVRKARNEISHGWDLKSLNEYFTREPISQLPNIEEISAESGHFADASKLREPICALRVRLIWITARLAYEAAYYWRAKSARLHPHILYEKEFPKCLTQVSSVAIGATKLAIG